MSLKVYLTLKNIRLKYYEDGFYKSKLSYEAKQS